MSDVKKYALDWANNKEHRRVYDGTDIKMTMPPVKKVKKLVDEGTSVHLYVENMPSKQAKPYLDVGATIFRCSSNIVSKIRKERNLPKSHDNDVRLIWELSENRLNEFREYEMEPPLNALYSLLKDVKETSNAFGNRCYATDQDSAKGCKSIITKMEKQIRAEVEKELNKFPVYEKWCKPRQIGADVTAGLIFFCNPEKFSNPSKMHKYLGLDVRKGEAARLRAGEEAGYSTRGRAFVLGAVAARFIQENYPVYKDLYNSAKKRFIDEGKAKNPKHADLHGKRVMIKCFLNHFWAAYRELAGLPTVTPWALAHDGHSTYIKPPTPEMVEAAHALQVQKRSDKKADRLRKELEEHGEAA